MRKFKSLCGQTYHLSHSGTTVVGVIFTFWLTLCLTHRNVLWPTYNPVFLIGQNLHQNPKFWLLCKNRELWQYWAVSAHDGHWLKQGPVASLAELEPPLGRSSHHSLSSKALSALLIQGASRAFSIGFAVTPPLLAEFIPPGLRPQDIQPQTP